MNLKEFLKLAGQQGKVVIIDDSGNVKGVFLPVNEYQKLSGAQTTEQKKEDIAEKVNREILQAQLEEVISSGDGGTATSDIHDHDEDEEQIDINPPAERIDALISRRAQDLFKSVPNYNYIPPEVATSSDEEIKPNFDDI